MATQTSIPAREDVIKFTIDKKQQWRDKQAGNMRKIHEASLRELRWENRVFKQKQREIASELRLPCRPLLRRLNASDDLGP